MQQINIKKNYLYRLSYEILRIITSVITVPYIARVLGADGVGIYSYTSSVMLYFTLFAALGTVSYGTREIAQHRDSRQEVSQLFWEIELMTVLTSVICLLAWLVIIACDTQYSCFYMALIPTLLGTMMDISWFFTGLEQIKDIVIRNSICKISGVVLVFSLIHDKDDILIYTLINSSIVLFGNLSMWTYLPKILVKVEWKNIRLKKHFRETLFYFIPTLATSVYTVLDKTLIGLITKDAYQNGYYEQATRIINTVKTFVYTSVNAVIGARNAYLFSIKKFDEIKEKIKKSMDFILLTGTGSICGIIGVAPGFIRLFLGEGYEPVIVLLYVMSPIIVIIGISNCLGNQYFTPGGQINRSSKVIILGSVINFILNLILIPFWGYMGAAIATLVAESIISILFVRMSDGYMTFSALWMYMRKRIVAGTVMCLVIIGIGKLCNCHDIIILAIQIISGIFIYGILLLFMHDQLLCELWNTKRHR